MWKINRVIHRNSRQIYVNMLKSLKTKRISLSRYIRIFAIDYTAFLSLIYVFVYGYNYSFSPLIFFPALFLAGYAAAYYFVHEHRRVPNEKEASLLAFGSFMCALIITFLISLLFIDYHNLLIVKYRTESILQDTAFLGRIFVIILGVSFAYLVLRVVYGWVPERHIRISK